MDKENHFYIILIIIGFLAGASLTYLALNGFDTYDFDADDFFVKTTYPETLTNDYVRMNSNRWNEVDIRINELGDKFTRIDNSSNYRNTGYYNYIVPGFYPKVYEIRYNYDTKKIKIWEKNDRK